MPINHTIYRNKIDQNGDFFADFYLTGKGDSFEP
jgi:hypothetical protein